MSSVSSCFVEFHGRGQTPLIPVDTMYRNKVTLIYTTSSKALVFVCRNQDGLPRLITVQSRSPLTVVENVANYQQTGEVPVEGLVVVQVDLLNETEYHVYTTNTMDIEGLHYVRGLKFTRALVSIPQFLNIRQHSVERTKLIPYEAYLKVSPGNELSLEPGDERYRLSYLYDREGTTYMLVRNEYQTGGVDIVDYMSIPNQTSGDHKFRPRMELARSVLAYQPTVGQIPVFFYWDVPLLKMPDIVYPELEVRIEGSRYYIRRSADLCSSSFVNFLNRPSFSATELNGSVSFPLMPGKVEFVVGSQGAASLVRVDLDREEFVFCCREERVPINNWSRVPYLLTVRYRTRDTGGKLEGIQSTKKVYTEHAVVTGVTRIDEHTYNTHMSQSLVADVKFVWKDYNVPRVIDTISGDNSNLESFDYRAESRPQHLIALAGSPVRFSLVGDNVQMKTYIYTTLKDPNYNILVPTAGGSNVPNDPEFRTYISIPKVSSRSDLVTGVKVRAPTDWKYIMSYQPTDKGAETFFTSENNVFVDPPIIPHTLDFALSDGIEFVSLRHEDSQGDGGTLDSETHLSVPVGL